MLRFNFFFGLSFISLCSKIITTKQKEIHLEPRIKLNLNIYKEMIRNWKFWKFRKSYLEGVTFRKQKIVAKEQLD